MERDGFRPTEEEERALSDAMDRSREAASQAEKHIREVLSNHTNLLAPDLIELIAKAEWERVYQETARESNFGKAAISRLVAYPPRN